jgi:hypothetical protein
VVAITTVTEEDAGLGVPEGEGLYNSTSNSVPPPASTRPVIQSRARATSTSYVNPSSTPAEIAPTIAVATSPVRLPAPLIIPRPQAIVLPQPDFSFTPASPDVSPSPVSLPSRPSFLERAYNTTEFSIRQLVSLVRPQGSESPRAYNRYRRGSDEDADSEKGLTGDEGEVESDQTTASSSEGVQVDKGRYWGLWASGGRSDAADGYFSLPATPPDYDLHDSAGKEIDLLAANDKFASLPTPALSAHSLSRSRSGRRSNSPVGTRLRARITDGWLRGVLSGWVGGGTSGKSGAVLRELGWTLGVLILGFVTSLGIALWLLKSLPM